MKIRSGFVSNSSSSSFIASCGDKFGSGVKRLPLNTKKDIEFGKYVIGTFSGEYTSFNDEELNEFIAAMRNGKNFLAGYSYNSELEQIVKIFIDEDNMLAFEVLFGDFDPEDYRSDFEDNEEDEEDE